MWWESFFKKLYLHLSWKKISITSGCESFLNKFRQDTSTNFAMVIFTVILCVPSNLWFQYRHSYASMFICLFWIHLAPILYWKSATFCDKCLKNVVEWRQIQGSLKQFYSLNYFCKRHYRYLTGLEISLWQEKLPNENIFEIF